MGRAVCYNTHTTPNTLCILWTIKCYSTPFWCCWSVRPFGIIATLSSGRRYIFAQYVWRDQTCSHYYYTVCKRTPGQLKDIVKTSLQTLLKRKATGEKGPATELEPGTYTFSRSFSHTSHRSQPQILCLPSPYVPVIEPRQLKDMPSLWYLLLFVRTTKQSGVKMVLETTVANQL